MKFIQVWLICVILVKKISCETTSTNSTILANRKQKDLIESFVDKSVNPCEDFYIYACGKWENVYKDAGTNYYETLSLLDYKANREITRAFNRIDLQNQPKFVKRAYEFYTSCTELEEYKTMHYLTWMKENENMKFPTLGKSRQKPQNYNWLRMLAIMRMYEMNGIFIKEDVIQRNEDPLKYIIIIYKPEGNSDFTPLTKDNLDDLLEYLGESVGTSKLWLEIEAFELAIMELIDYYDRYTPDEEYYPDWPLKKVKDIPLPWLKDYLKILLNQTELDPNMEVYLQNIPFFTDLEELLKKYSQLFLSKYLEIRFLWHLHQEGPSNFLAEHCISNVRSFLPMAVDWLYEHQHPDLQLEFPKITELFDEIRKLFNRTIQQNYNGFNETVVDYLLAKINTMHLKINNIPRTDTVKTLEKFYENLDLNIDEFYGNHLKLLKFNFIVNHNLLSNTTQHMDFFVEKLNYSSSTLLNFNYRFNTVVVPLAVLHQPIYQPDSDNIYKYSSFGFMLAQAMLSVFDNYGLEIDDKGVRYSQHYEDIVTNPLSNANINCLLKLNPSEAETKIDDVSALHYVYQMYNNSKTDDTDDSMNTLFFLNFAQYFCGSSRGEEAVSQETSDYERITDALMHFPEFSKVYLCNSHHRMYPPSGCYT